MNAEQQNIVESIKTFIQTELAEAEREISADEELLEGSLVNSMGVMRLVAFIDTTYGYQVPAGDITIENFATINDIADYLAPKLVNAQS